MIVVLTADEPLATAVGQVWSSWLTGPWAMAAPMLLRYEVTNALHRLAQAGRMPERSAAEALTKALGLPIQLFGEPPLHTRALELARRFRLPAAYDPHYLALAEALDCEFYTGDLRLVNALGGALPWVKTVPSA